MPSLTSALREEYQALFGTCDIRPQRQQDVETLVTRIAQNQARYDVIANATGIPWYVVGVMHNMEASLNFRTHLHNGDPLTQRTVHVPQGRPVSGTPPFTWEESALDALRLEKFDRVRDWTVPGTLYQLEIYNGFGYRSRHPEVLSPYLWSFSNHYTRGKFIADGTFSPTAVSAQCGAAVLLRRMSEIGLIHIPIESGGQSGEVDLEALGAAVRFDPNRKSAQAEALQRFLNTFPGIFVKVDGFTGEKTSDAFKKVTGPFLLGDPRA
jgi:lysozyme family protein